MVVYIPYRQVCILRMRLKSIFYWSSPLVNLHHHILQGTRKKERWRLAFPFSKSESPPCIGQLHLKFAIFIFPSSGLRGWARKRKKGDDLTKFMPLVSISQSRSHHKLSLYRTTGWPICSVTTGVISKIRASRLNRGASLYFLLAMALEMQGRRLGRKVPTPSAWGKKKA